MSDINYIGRVDIGNQQFSYVNVSFSMRQVSSSSDNIFSGGIKKKKGWRRFCNIDIFITNKAGESASLTSLIATLKNMGKGGTTICVEGYSKDGGTVVFNESFDTLESEINYSDYLVNSKIGLRFSFSISQSTVQESLPSTWKDVNTIYTVLYDYINIEFYKAGS